MPWQALAVVGGKQLWGAPRAEGLCQGAQWASGGSCFPDTHSGLAHGMWALRSDSQLLELGDLVQAPPDTGEDAEAPRRRS